MQHQRWIARAFALLLALILLMPVPAQAASNIKLREFGDRGLDIYRTYARDVSMLKALIAVDLAEGRSIAKPDAQAVARVAASMSQSHQATVEMYVAYYTADASHKQRIMTQTARLVDIGYMFTGKVFPIPAGYEVWYGDSWGAARGDSGQRSHSGIDLAADYGVPILSMGDGVVEAVGWNTLGGWRVGVRDKDGLYYYYAHMSSFEAGIKVGVKVAAGQVLGYVGDSGYGPVGTTGVLTPHLHICVYEGSPKTACNPFAVLNWTSGQATVNQPLSGWK